ncbi:MAG: RtcB family protein [Verrucomicrobiota bacterium]
MNDSHITGQDLIDAGYPSGPIIGEMLKAAAVHQAKGITDKKYLLKLLKRDFALPPPKQSLRETPAPLTEAIKPTNDLEEKNVSAVRRYMHDLLKVPIIQRGAVMPDACPAGSATATIPVGGAIAVENAIIPSAHSADICCSMFATVFASDHSIDEKLDALIASTRFGAGGRKPDDLVYHPVIDEHVWDNPFLKDLKHYAEIHMADQGDGNHFAYLGKISANEKLIASLKNGGQSKIADALRNHLDQNTDQSSELKVLVTHHGSRGLGARLYKRGQQAAIKQTERAAQGIPKAAAWIDYSTDQGAAYWEALQYAGRWTRANHEAIHRRFLKKIETPAITDFGNEHNFVWKRGENLFLHGKGATPAWNDPSGNPLLGLIPLNMAAPILLVLGHNNEDYLSFAPHGAGRNQSRTATMKPYRNKDGTLDEEAIARTIADSTKEIAVRWFYGKPDLSETPVAYKSADQVKAQIQQFNLADVIAEIEPLGCIMAGDPGPRPWQKEKPLTPKQKRQLQHRAERRRVRQDLGSRDWEKA